MECKARGHLFEDKIAAVGAGDGVAGAIEHVAERHGGHYDVLLARAQRRVPHDGEEDERVRHDDQAADDVVEHILEQAEPFQRDLRAHARSLVDEGARCARQRTISPVVNAGAVLLRASALSIVPFAAIAATGQAVLNVR